MWSIWVNDVFSCQPIQPPEMEQTRRWGEKLQSLVHYLFSLFISFTGSTHLFAAFHSLFLWINLLFLQVFRLLLMQTMNVNQSLIGINLCSLYFQQVQSVTCIVGKMLWLTECRQTCGMGSLSLPWAVIHSMFIDWRWNVSVLGWLNFVGHVVDPFSGLCAAFLLFVSIPI